ncbi:MAG: hypothetical protein GOV00_02135 [Candidatus Altiarchaeota archaeon]|nr:hypothetical protein [Candidatus Altiarchaeota archaeon]
MNPKLKRMLIKPRMILMMLLLLWSLFQLKPWGGLDVEWGFDVQGGSRIVLFPTNQSVNLEDVTTVIQNRLNIYGLKDIRVRGASDLNNKYVVVEAAGLTEEDIESLLASEGRFEGRIGNTTIFTNEDVRVDKTRQRFYFDNPTGVYRYHVPIVLSREATQAFAEATENLVPLGFNINNSYLDKSLDLYIDDILLEELNIPADMRGREIPSAEVTGGDPVYIEAKNNRDRMVAILMTGSVPTKLEIVSIQNVSPTLGREFLKSTALAAVVAACLLSVVLYFRYRNIQIVGSVLFTALSELVITMSLASFINWQLDLSAIAGLIITLGTGVNQQIIMTDEVFHDYSKQKVSNAMFVILAAFGTMVAVMFPLMFIGVGSVRGFAVTTIIGVSIGYLFTRPGYLAILEEII